MTAGRVWQQFAKLRAKVTATQSATPLEAGGPELGTARGGHGWSVERKMCRH